MSDQYKITEIASLYGLCTDTLRYYEEQGLLHPVRDPRNGYRLYGIQDICNLNVIRSLRQLGLSTAEIGSYLNSRTVDSTLELLRREDELIGERIARLTEARALVRRQAKDLRRSRREPVDVPSLQEFPARPCFLLERDVILEQDIDFVLKKLEKKHEGVLHVIGTQQMGAQLNGEQLAGGVFTHFSSVFFLGDDPALCDSEIPAGQYACLYYAGEYDGIEPAWKRLLAFLNENHLAPAAPPIELYPIDAHHTNRHSEYLTQVQVLTRPAK